MGGLRCYSALAPAAALLCAVCLAACGGDDDSGSTAATTPSAESGTEAGGDSRSSPNSASDGGASSGDSSGSDEGGGGEDSSPREVTPDNDRDLPDRGEVSSRSASFQQYSAKGKLHLAEFGEEASDGDLSAVEATVVSYLEAVGNEEWEEACTYVLDEVKAQLAEFVKQANKSGGCSEALPTAFSQKGSEESIYASEGIASLRIKKGDLAGEGAGFALFHASNGEDRWIAVKKQNGEWGVLSTVPQPFR